MGPWVGFDICACSVISEVFRAKDLCPSLDGSFGGGRCLPTADFWCKTGDIFPRGFHRKYCWHTFGNVP